MIKKIFVVTIIHLTLVSVSHSKLAQPKIWKGKQNENQLSDIQTCKKHFLVGPSFTESDMKNCSPGHNSTRFLDKKKNIEIAAIAHTSWCNDKLEIKYYVTKLESRVKVSRDQFCKHVVDYNKLCEDCIN